MEYLPGLIIGMIFSGIMFITIWFVHKRILQTKMMSMSIDEYTSHLTSMKENYKIILLSLIGGWILIIAITILFNPTKRFDSHSPDVGSNVTIQESETYEPPSKEEINRRNKEELKEKEVEREREIQEERKKSRDEFNDFLNSTN